MNIQNKKEEYQRKIQQIQEMAKTSSIKEALKSMNLSPGTYYAWRKYLSSSKLRPAPTAGGSSTEESSTELPPSYFSNTLSLEPQNTSKVIALIGDADQISSLLSKAIEVSRRAS
jgi:transposase-like protein